MSSSELKNKPIVVAVTGASGSLYAFRLLDNLLKTQQNIHLIITDSAKHIAKEELSRDQFAFLTENARLIKYEPNQFNVSIASGSFLTHAMIVIPASMGSIGRIACGTSDSLIVRSADVHLKEKRKLILVPRETPLNRIHLENLLNLHDAGAIILPAIPSFYSKPKSINDIVDTVVARVLDQINIPHDLNVRYDP